MYFVDNPVVVIRIHCNYKHFFKLTSFYIQIIRICRGKRSNRIFATKVLMKIFISGASGLVGGNCYHYFKKQGWNVIGSHFSFPLDYTVPYDTLHLDNDDNFNKVSSIFLHTGTDIPTVQIRFEHDIYLHHTRHITSNQLPMEQVIIFQSTRTLPIK